MALLCCDVPWPCKGGVGYPVDELVLVQVLQPLRDVHRDLVVAVCMFRHVSVFVPVNVGTVCD